MYVKLHFSSLECIYYCINCPMAQSGKYFGRLHIYLVQMHTGILDVDIFFSYQPMGRNKHKLFF